MRTLKSLRMEYLMTQKELADLFGVSDRTIYQIEKDSTNIRDTLLSKYMTAFNIKYDDIFLGNEYENNVFEGNYKRKLKENIKKNKEVIQ